MEPLKRLLALALLLQLAFWSCSSKYQVEHKGFGTGFPIDPKNWESFYSKKNALVASGSSSSKNLNMLPWQLNWVVKHFGKYLKAQEMERDPLSSDNKADLDKHDYFGKRFGRYSRDMWSSRIDSHTLRTWFENNKLLRFAVTSACKGIVLIAAGTFFFRKIAHWYSGISEYELLLDQQDYDYHSYGSNNLNGTIGISTMVNMDKRLVSELSLEPLYDRMVSALERPCFPHTMKVLHIDVLSRF